MDKRKYKYDVAVSFAEEDRNAALALSLAFEIVGVKKIFYYPDRRLDKIGESTGEALNRIFRYEARYAVALWSTHYFSPEKKYVGIEMNAIRNRMHEDKSTHFMIPVKLHEDLIIEDEELSNINYFPWNYDPKSLARDLHKLLGSEIDYDNAQVGKNYYFTGDQSFVVIGGKIVNAKQNNWNKK